MKKMRLAKRWEGTADGMLSELSSKSDDSNGLIDLAIGEPDLGTNHEIVKFAFSDALKGNTGYTKPDGDDDFISSVKQYYRKVYQLDFATEQIRATVGAMHGMYLAMRAVLDFGDEVIIIEPYYSPYVQQVLACDGIPVFFNGFYQKNSKNFLEEMERTITDKTKVIILNSPNNPSGEVYSVEIMKGLARLAENHGIYIFSDEVYNLLCFLPKYTSIAKYAPNNTVIFGSFSKAFAMTGWRIGYMIGPVFINDAARKISDFLTYTAPTISQKAGIYALENLEIADKYKKCLENRLNYIFFRVSKNKYLSMKRCQGGMFAFINIENTGMSSIEFSKRLLKEYKILVAPGNLFSKSFGEKYIRISATKDMEVLKETFDRIDNCCLSFEYH
ncbi:aspartate/tyrosine/aromatic aminotransferase [Lactococcus lactis subsp. lactis]|uniref:Aminotransferase n=2 Tax=Lactococcus lactis subsp. lactis TaxID=1360 RepID=A0A0B8QKE2_LACLL|nr:aminotransferase class I/II-fold pyridoxal phosphate-dependent enzyme [Lactococcus lactis]QPT51395.1 aminotransferase class I/II-fold pyridoxal phosphate-dependent enzyme [Lactococcus lactis]GAM80305.1 aspartate/tyrosine/aromatic aminotransferase [Lactococcus lactis subsp. lactis]